MTCILAKFRDPIKYCFFLVAVSFPDFRFPFVLLNHECQHTFFRRAGRACKWFCYISYQKILHMVGRTVEFQSKKIFSDLAFQYFSFCLCCLPRVYCINIKLIINSLTSHIWVELRSHITFSQACTPINDQWSVVYKMWYTLRYYSSLIRYIFLLILVDLMLDPCSLL